MSIKINKKFVLIFALLNCARIGFSNDQETIDFFKILSKMHSEFASHCESLVAPVDIPASMLDLFRQAHMHYCRQFIEFFQTPGLTGLPTALSQRIARTQIDDYEAIDKIVQDMNGLELTVSLPQNQISVLNNQNSCALICIACR